MQCVYNKSVERNHDYGYQKVSYETLLFDKNDTFIDK